MQTDTIQRNWAAEAVAIASGQSTLIPQREHLAVLAQQAESTIRNTLKMASILLAVLVDLGYEQVPIPGGLLAHVTAQQLGIDIQPVRGDDGSEVADGSLLVTVRRPAPTTPKRSIN